MKDSKQWLIELRDGCDLAQNAIIQILWENLGNKSFVEDLFAFSTLIESIYNTVETQINK